MALLSRFRLTKRAVTSKLTNFNTYQKGQLLRLFRFPIFAKFQSNNVFLNTLVPISATAKALRFSAGLFDDYKRKKKKKKTYMLGFELGFRSSDRLLEAGVSDLKFYCKGHGAQKRGVYQAFLRRGLSLSTIVETTPVAHNGTRPCGRRRL